MATERPIKYVVVLGATGNIGKPIVDALVNHPNRFIVTAVTRDKSKASPFASQVKIAESDLSDDSLRTIFRGQDAVISCAATAALPNQIKWVDIAIESGVQRFLPSEFGMDSAHPNATTYLPLLGVKTKVIDHLKANQEKISWTAIITGMFFDWALQIPIPGSWNIAQRRATIYDGGNYEGEWTNVGRIGEAVAAALSPEHVAETANEYVYINSFTITQNQVLAALEKSTGQKFEVTEDTTAGLRERLLERRKKDPSDFAAAMGLIVASAYGQGEMNEYSKYVEGGLWNKRLGLGEESMEQTVRDIVGT